MKDCLPSSSLAAVSIVSTTRNTLIVLTKALLIGVLLLSYPVFSAPEDRGIFDYADTYFYPVNNNDQIPWGIVTTLMQDHEGYVWVGTQKGAMRFDGYQFQYHEPRPDENGHLAYPWVETFAELAPGEIWIGARRGLAVYNADTGRFKNHDALPSGNNSIDISMVEEIHNSERGVWLVAEKKILLVNRSNFSTKIIGQPFFDGKLIEVNSIQFFGKEKLWVGAQDGLYIYSINDATFSKVDPKLSQHINELTLDSHENLWISTVNGGLRVIDTSKVTTYEEIRSEIVDGGSYRGVTPISDTEIWAMKNRDGIRVVDIASRSIVKHLKPEPLIDHSLLSADVRAVIKDQSGIIWAGHWGNGILLHDKTNQYIKPLSVRSLGKMQSDHFHIDEIKLTQNFGIWLLGSKKVISLDPKDSYNIKHWPTINQFLKKTGDTTIYAASSKILADGSEHLYFITGNSVLFSFDPHRKKITELSTEAKLGCLESFGMVLDATDKLWIGCRQPSKLIRYDLNTQTSSIVPASTQKEIGLLNNMQIGPQNNIWLAATNGLYSIPLMSPSTQKPIEVEDFTGEHTVSVLFDKSGGFWVDSYSGLHRGSFVAGKWKFQAINEALGIKKTQLFGNMLLNEKDWIWSDEGALDIQKLEFHPLRKGEGFNTGPNWVGTFNKLNDGTLLFGTDNQLIVMQSEHYQPWNYSGPMVVSQVIIDNQTLASVPDVIKLNANNKSFSADIALLDYYNPNSSIYAYKLEGYDDDWIHTDAKNRRVSYTNLSAGDYTLRIKGANTSNIWSEMEVAIPIIKAAAIYETFAFRALMAVLFMIAILGLHRLKVRHHKEKEQQLTLTVNERTNELQKSLDDLKVTQEKLMDTEKQALLGRLVRGLAHELNTPLGVIKMTESMLNDKLLDIFSVMSDCATEAADKMQPQVNKIFSLLRENLDKTITLVQHFKSADIDNDEEAKLQWVEIAPYFGLILDNNKVEASIDGPKDASIFCDKKSLTVVVSELLKNSKNHGGDKRFIRYRKVEENHKTHIEIIVEDHNQGIPEDILGQIFDPFFSSKHIGGNPGLGLYIVENIVKFRLRGSINVRSEANKVTSFILSFPAQYRAEHATQTETAISAV